MRHETKNIVLKRRTFLSKKEHSYQSTSMLCSASPRRRACSPKTSRSLRLPRSCSHPPTSPETPDIPSARVSPAQVRTIRLWHIAQHWLELYRAMSEQLRLLGNTRDVRQYDLQVSDLEGIVNVMLLYKQAEQDRGSTNATVRAQRPPAQSLPCRRWRGRRRQ
jgi:hypothetical protein